MQSPMGANNLVRSVDDTDYRRMHEGGSASWAGATAMPSRGLSVLLVGFAALQSVLTSGMVFGWAPLQLMLEEEGVYSNLCPGGVGPCPAQAGRLREIYTMATSAFCFCVWPTGIVLDRFGPRVCCMMGSLFFGAGCALMAISTNELDYFMHGFCLMAIGGLPVVLSMMHLSNLLPEYAGTIITIFNVMIDVSSLNFKLVYVIFQTGITRKDLFMGYCAVPALIFVSAPLLWPMVKYEARQDTTAALTSPGGTTRAPAASKRSSLEGKPFSQQATSMHFILCVLFTAFQLLHVNLYIGTVDDQVREKVAGGPGNSTQISMLGGPPLEHSSSADFTLGYRPLYTTDSPADAQQLITQLTSAFAWILPLGGVAMTYPVGWMLDNLAMWQCVFALSFAGLIHSCLGILEGSATMYASFVLFAYFRAALFGTMATEVAFTFGHENFGKLWGILYCVSGLLNACIGVIAKQAAVEGTFFYINCALLGAGVLLMGYPLWLKMRSGGGGGAEGDASEWSGRGRTLGPSEVASISKGAIDRWCRDLHEGNVEDVRRDMRETLSRIA